MKALSVAKVSARNVVLREKPEGFTSRKSYFPKDCGDETTVWIPSSDSNAARLSGESKEIKPT